MKFFHQHDFLSLISQIFPLKTPIVSTNIPNNFKQTKEMLF